MRSLLRSGRSPWCRSAQDTRAAVRDFVGGASPEIRPLGSLAGHQAKGKALYRLEGALKPLAPEGRTMALMCSDGTSQAQFEAVPRPEFGRH